MSSTSSSSKTPYLDKLYAQFQQNPDSVPPGWRSYFKGEGARPGLKLVAAAAPAPVAAPRAATNGHAATQGSPAAGEASQGQNRVSQLIQAFREHGHKWAHLNPLAPAPEMGADLGLEAFGLDESMMDTEFATDGILPTPSAPLKEILAALHTTYTGSIGVQYTHLPSRAQQLWLREKMEVIHNTPQYGKEEKKRLWQGLMAADKFERFLHTKFIGMKRFSVEGGDALIPMADTMIDLAGEGGVTDIVIGMAHRGRMNMLVNILNKPMEEMFAAFNDALVYDDDFSTGDVKYHQGQSYDVKTRSGHNMHISLLNNPSHLEVVNPVVMGSARAKQKKKGKQAVLPLLVHGDSAFAGQGVVPESLNLMALKGYDVGGTIHIVINNQIGFTANPRDTFSGEYCTDVARMLQVPIFHVNGDDVEACNHVMKLATQWRNEFGLDVVVDLVCYRRYGHNEGDDPTFTQPVMYEAIKKHPRPAELYKKQLTQEAGVPENELAPVEEAYSKKLKEAFEKSRSGAKVKPEMFGGAWANMGQEGREPKTAIGKPVMNKMAENILNWGAGFNIHPKVAKGMEKRQAMYKGEEPLDWGAAEVAAYGSLLAEGIDVRLSGQDVKRGTFSHRHVVHFDTQTTEETAPIAHMAAKSASLEIWNSPLSELAVLGFEFGHTLADPHTLTIWEAQFGDFANGAQIVIDQFISSSEVKWHRMSGLVMQLPHGYEGQGPEHSSARIERYLQMCAQSNMSVAIPSTPGQMFHLLRRQMLRPYRRPLIAITPKSLLRHPKAVSEVTELTGGAFQPLIADTEVPVEKARRLLLCTGKLYYDLLAAREEGGIKDVSIARLEELYPLPEKEIAALIAKAPKVELVWAQEEPRNQGAWTYLLENLQPQLKTPLIYVGRAAAASTSVGSVRRHQKEQAEVVNAALGKPTGGKKAAGRKTK